MLRTVSDPGRSGIQVEPIIDQNKSVINGWTVVAHRGSDGEWYERLEKDGRVRWFWLEQDELFSMYGDDED